MKQTTINEEAILHATMQKWHVAWKTWHFNDLTLTFSRCTSFVHHSIMVNVTWPHSDQSTDNLRLTVGHMASKNGTSLKLGLRLHKLTELGCYKCSTAYTTIHYYDSVSMWDTATSLCKISDLLKYLPVNALDKVNSVSHSIVKIISVLQPFFMLAWYMLWSCVCLSIHLSVTSGLNGFRKWDESILCRSITL